MSINQIVTNMGISWWDLIEKALAVVGVVGIVVSIFRLIFTLKRVTWVSNVSIEDYPLDYDEESTEKNPESITLMDEECVQCGCGNTVVFKPVGGKNETVKNYRIYESKRRSWKNNQHHQSGCRTRKSRQTHFAGRC